jgi:hypothetical protein
MQRLLTAEEVSEYLGRSGPNAVPLAAPGHRPEGVQSGQTSAV